MSSRILHLLATPYWSGPAELVFHIALAQRALGHQVTVAVDRKRSLAPSEELGVPRFAAAELLEAAPLELSTHSSPVSMWRDRAQLTRLSVDVVHAHMSHDHLLARWGRPAKAILVRSIHAPRSLRRSMPKADAYTVPSHALAETWSRHPCIVLPAFAGPEYVPSARRDELRAALGITGRPVIGMISSFQASRRHDLGLEAFAAVLAQRPEAHMYLLGDGALEVTLRERVRALGLAERVHFLGYQSGERFLERLQCLDEVWILGLGNEHGGRAAMQARAVGARVIAVREGGLADAADILLDQPDVGAICAAATSERRLDKPVIRREEAAERLIRLYGSVRRP